MQSVVNQNVVMWHIPVLSSVGLKVQLMIIQNERMYLFISAVSR
jgi:hypothetical protein